MAIGETVNLRALDRQAIAVEFEFHGVFGDVAEHALMIIDRFAVADDQNVAIGLHAEDARPFGSDLGRFRLQSDVAAPL